MSAGQIDLLDPTPLVRDTERRLALRRAADLVRGEHVRKNTDTAYKQDWARWREFVATMDAIGAPIETISGNADVLSDSLLLFVRWLAQGGRTALDNTIKPHAPESMRRRLNGVLAGWRRAGIDYPRGISADARRWIDGHADWLVEQNISTGRGQARLIELTGDENDDVIRIAEATELAVRAGKLHAVEAARDMALILIGMAVAARSAEASFVQVADIASGENDGLYVAIRKSKKSHRRPYVKRGARDATCPVRAWHHWQATSGIVTGPAFRRCRDGRVRSEGLSPEGCSDVVTRAAKRAGITGATFHGLRAGFATAAARAKKDKAEIADQGGWDRNSAALDVYIRQVKVWQNAVTEGIGF